MKKISLLLCFLIVFSLFACGNPEASTQPSQSSQSTQQSTTSSTSLRATGYEDGMVPITMVFVNGYLYVHEASPALSALPASADLIGTVQENDDWNIPSEQLCAAHLEVGQKIYGSGANPLRVYVYFPESNCYRAMIRSDQVDNWWSEE